MVSAISLPSDTYRKLSCIRCGNRNIFSLGILITKKPKILCRNPCLFRYEPTLRHWWNTPSWSPLVHERALRFLNVDFRGSPRMPSNYLNIPLPVDEDLRIYRKYPSFIEYLRVYRGLMDQELDEDLRNGQEKQTNLILHKKEGNIFFFGDEIGYKCKPNDSIIVEATDSDWKSKATLIRKEKNGEFHIRLAFGSSNIPDEVDIKVDNKSNPNRLIISGLEKLASRTFDLDLMNSILTGATTIMKDPSPRHSYNVPNLFTLNPSQTEAVAHALKYKCSVIQGPPGTGKTETAAAIIYHILEKCRSENALRQDFDLDNRRRNNEETINRERNDYNNNIAQRRALKKELERRLICAIIGIGNQRINALTGNPRPRGRTRWRNRGEQEILNNVREKVKKAEESLKLLDDGEEYDDNFIRDMINHDFCNFETEHDPLISEYLTLIQGITEPFVSSIPEIRDITSSLFDYRPKDRILVCTFSNTAIKVLKQRLISKGIPSLQIYGKMQEETDENIDDPNSLHYILRNTEEYKQADVNIKRF